jgi:hypothetical protein
MRPVRKIDVCSIVDPYQPYMRRRGSAARAITPRTETEGRPEVVSAAQLRQETPADSRLLTRGASGTVRPILCLRCRRLLQSLLWLIPA